MRPVESTPDPAAIRRITFLSRVESMINVGCKYGPNDLEPRIWNELIMMALERQRMEEIIRKARDRQREKDKPPPEAEAALRASRKELGIPTSGDTLFPQKKPMR